MTIAKKKNAFGLFFLVVGLAIILAAIWPAFSKPPLPVQIWVLVAGIALDTLGALIYMPTETRQAMETFSLTVENSSLPVVGGHGHATATATVTATPAPASDQAAT